MAQHDMVLDNNPGLAFRQDLNNAIAALVSASLGNTAPTTTYAGQEWIDTGTTIDIDGPWLRQRNSANTAWTRVRKVDIDQILLKVQQDQIAVTTTGTSPSFTISTKLTNSVAIAANQRFRVKFHATGTTGSNTLARDGLTPYSLKQYDSTGAKISAVVVSGMLADVEFDGTDYVILDPLPAVISSSTPMANQTVLSGPVDSSGYASFGGTVGSSTLTATGTITATCGGGGVNNRIGSITSPSWTSPSGSGTGYLMLTISSTGFVTTNVHSLLPIYQHGGPYSTVNDQFTYNIQENTAKVGNGTTAIQVYEVCIGECPYTSGAWSGSVTWYAINGRYESPLTSMSSGVRTAFSHNIGTIPKLKPSISFVNQIAEAGYSPGYEICDGYTLNTGANNYSLSITNTSNNSTSVTIGAAIAIPAFSTGVGTVLTLANWKYKVIISRGW